MTYVVAPPVYCITPIFVYSTIIKRKQNGNSALPPMQNCLLTVKIGNGQIRFSGLSGPTFYYSGSNEPSLAPQLKWRLFFMRRRLHKEAYN
jgi:hypothetical protein